MKTPLLFLAGIIAYQVYTVPSLAGTIGGFVLGVIVGVKAMAAIQIIRVYQPHKEVKK